MRKREPLKSPVREIRTPGSVRGPLGNRRSYRDGTISWSIPIGREACLYLASPQEGRSGLSLSPSGGRSIRPAPRILGFTGTRRNSLASSNALLSRPWRHVWSNHALQPTAASGACGSLVPLLLGGG